MFDTQECIEVEDKSANDDGCIRSCRDKHDLRGNKKALNRRQNGASCSEEDIELQEMGGNGVGDIAAGEHPAGDVGDQNGDEAGQSSRRQSRIDKAVSSSGAFVQGGMGIAREVVSRMSNEDDEGESLRQDSRAFVSTSVSEGMATFGIYIFDDHLCVYIQGSEAYF